MNNKIRAFLIKNLSLWVMASITLGLAPFAPEPHIWKQIKNIANGRLTETMDWVDLFMHGAPWFLLVLTLLLKYILPNK